MNGSIASDGQNDIFDILFLFIESFFYFVFSECFWNILFHYFTNRPPTI